MEWQGWFTLAVLAGMFVTLVRGWQTPDMTLLAGAVILAVTGIITPAQLVAGFSNEGMLTVASMFVVATGLRETGAIDSFGRLVLHGARTQSGMLLRLCPQIGVVSAFLNNTAVVAIILPILNDWCRRHRISPSRVLIPLSYAAVLGGTCTLIGTSTNLVVNGLLIREGSAQTDTVLAHALREIGFFEVSLMGIAAFVVGFGYLMLAGAHLLPDRKELLGDIDQTAREYLVNMVVADDSPLIGQQIGQAGLRHLPGLFLIEIIRGGRLIAPVTPDTVLEAGDRLTFTGQRSTIVDLERFPGLNRAAASPDEPAEVDTPERFYCEAVVSVTSPLIGKNIRDANFRALYNAVVVAVHRGGEHLTGRVGDIVLQAGDTLLLQTGPHFREAHANDPDFYLVSGVRGQRPVRREKAGISLALLVALVVVMSTGVVPIVVAAMFTAGAMIMTGCMSAGIARRGVAWNVLVAIAAALAVGEAMTSSGAAEMIAQRVVGATQTLGPVAALAAIYLIAVLFTETLTHAAAAVLVFPLALSTSLELGVNPRPFAMAVLFGASYGFATPIGYQTNLMVYGPGGYRFTDFAKVGLPLNILLWLLCVLLIPLIWPFQMPAP